MNKQDLLWKARVRRGWRLAAESIARQTTCPIRDCKGADWHAIQFLHWQHLEEHPEIKCACRH